MNYEYLSLDKLKKTTTMKKNIVLELKDLAPYLPYKLKIKTRSEIRTMVYTNEYYGNLKDENPNPIALSVVLENNCQLILRPLSDLVSKEFLDYFNFGSDMEEAIIERGFFNFNYLSVCDYIKLLENHFDVFGLIEKGLAISIHNITQSKI